MTDTNLTCFFLDISLEKTNAVITANIVTCIFNAVFSLITVFGNLIIISAIWNTPELHSPSNVLLCCLAGSDLLVGLVCQPSLVAFKIAELMESYRVYCTLRIIQSLASWTTSGGCLLTLICVCIDRLLALTLHLRYNAFVSIRRVLLAVVALWIFCIGISASRFCFKNWIILPVIVLFLSFIVTALSTMKIFHTVRKHQRQIYVQQQTVSNRGVDRMVFKCRKCVVTVLYVYSLFLLFYLPFLVTLVIDYIVGYTLHVKIAYDYATTAVFINSSLNPVVYCWRIKEIRRAVKNALKIS